MVDGVRRFLHLLLIQSVLPFMDRCMQLWNEQVRVF